MRVFKKIMIITLIVIISIAAIAGVAILISSNHRSDPSDIIKYDTDNPYITGKTELSAHRSGGGLAPEQTLMALKFAAENEEFKVDIFEFDLHITKDSHLVLLHDDTLDRTSDSEKIFGRIDVRPEEMTLEELKKLNMGAKFMKESGEMPYARLEGEDVPDELKILSVEEALDYLTGVDDFRYIIEIKNSGELGKKGVDILYGILKERDLLEDTVFGTFHEEVTKYVDGNYSDLARSTTINEVLKFYLAAIFDLDSYEPPCSVLQIPFCAPYLTYGINLGTATVINFAHSHNMAVQYWTINDVTDMEYLVSMGADCIMTDYPDRLYNVIK